MIGAASSGAANSSRISYRHISFETCAGKRSLSIRYIYIYFNFVTIHVQLTKQKDPSFIFLEMYIVGIHHPEHLTCTMTMLTEVSSNTYRRKNCSTTRGIERQRGIYSGSTNKGVASGRSSSSTSCTPEAALGTTVGAGEPGGARVGKEYYNSGRPTPRGGLREHQ